MLKRPTPGRRWRDSSELGGERAARRGREPNRACVWQRVGASFVQWLCEARAKVGGRGSSRGGGLGGCQRLRRLGLLGRGRELSSRPGLGRPAEARADQSFAGSRAPRCRPRPREERCAVGGRAAVRVQEEEEEEKVFNASLWLCEASAARPARRTCAGLSARAAAG